MKRRETINTSYFLTSLYKYVLMILTALLLCSCWSLFDKYIYRDYSIEPLKYDRQYNKLLGVATLRMGTDCQNGELLIYDRVNKLCVYKRNLLIGDLIAISDGMCENHMKTILGNEATVNIITGTLTNAFAGAATVSSGAIAKSILAALAFFSNSERSLVNETVYKSVLVPAIIKKISEMRLNERNAIMTKYEANKGGKYEDYPVNFALADIIKYHQTCSFMVGLQKALEEGTQPAPGQDRASLEQKLKVLVLEKDTRISELRRQKQGITDEEIKKDSYIIYLDGQIDAITKKLGGPETKKPAVPLTFSGKIESVDAGAKSIVVTSTDGKTKNTFVVDEQTTKISQDGKTLTFADLKKDMQVDVSYDKMEGNKATATAIKVSPPPAPSTTFSGKIESVDAGAKSIVVTSTDGKTKNTFVVDEQTTKISQDGKTLTFADLKKDMQVDVSYDKMEGNKATATAIKVSPPKAPKGQ